MAARLNVSTGRTSFAREDGSGGFTHEGGEAWRNLTPMQSLRRAVLSCFLWEKQFYCDGQDIAARINAFAEQVDPSELALLAVEARTQGNLRHAPLLLLEVLSRTGAATGLVPGTVARTIQRADEMGELLAIIWEMQKARGQNSRKIPHGVLKGLQLAMLKFDAYQLGKYDREGIKLRDVLRLARPKPDSEERSALWKQVVTRTLPVPDTWEVALSGGADKKATWERLLSERKLGYLALLRNLRNMLKAGVDTDLVKAAIVARKGGAHRVLPFRYVAAARAAPEFEPALDTALLAAIEHLPQLPGKTAVLVDVSGSMRAPLSGKSDMRRWDAAAALASIVAAEDLRVFSFSDTLVKVPARKGMSGVDAIINSQPNNGTNLIGAVRELNRMDWYDRLIVLTDEQTHDPRRYGGQAGGMPAPRRGARGYVINVASYQNGVGYGSWVHIDGFSERVLTFIHEFERDATRTPRTSVPMVSDELETVDDE